MRTTTRQARVAGAVALVLAIGATACDDSSSIDGVLAPSALSGTVGGTTGGGRAGVATAQVPLLGSWTRIAAAGGLLTEQTWSFGSDGSGVRTTVTRTALGIPLTVEQQTFAWDAGGGILLLRFRHAGAVDTTIRASYALLIDVRGTVLRLDGLDYARTAG